jgi:hypothetical protein
MRKIVRSSGLDLDRHFDTYLRPALKSARWTLRLTDHSGRPSPVFVVKEHFLVPGEKDASGKEKKTIQDRGALFGDALGAFAIVRKILSESNRTGIPRKSKKHRRLTSPIGNLPLDEETGFKFALMVKLQDGWKDLDRWN